MPKNKFTFEISLSILNHLGRNLYRNFITVLGEAISNSWDADASNVFIYIDRDENSFVIKDDGCGMNSDDFQNKFLRVGYSKRSENGMSSPNGRPYIGAKGIGKLALLSCAEKISIATKTQTSEYTGGIIDNSILTEAIEHDLKPDEYPLGNIDLQLFDKYLSGHNKGTIIYFQETKEDMKNTISYLRKLIALYFRFSLIDKSFTIFVNDEQVTLADIKALSDSTEFVWKINNLIDPFLDTLKKLKSETNNLIASLNITGFIASVEFPRNLKIAGTEEKVGIDLFVNGRLRERDVLKHLPDYSTRHIASYLYGQIHFDELDQDGTDRFTSSREGVISGETKFKELIEVLREHILVDISDKWDELRLLRNEDGDDENPRKTLKERRAGSLYSLSSKDYSDSSNDKVGGWLKELRPDAEFNIPSYVDCFISENLVRKYIKDKPIQLTQNNFDFIATRRTTEAQHKVAGNINVDIKQDDDDLFHLEMDSLAQLVDPQRGPANCLASDAKTYRPIRNSLMHTALLTKEAKQRLNSVYDNIKARIKTLLHNNGPTT